MEQCRENAEECIGDPLPDPTVAADDVEIDGDSARAHINTAIGPFGVALVREEGEWKANSLFVPDDDLPDGVDVVEIEMLDFAFDFDADALSSGDFALHAVNNGEQIHEIVLVGLPDEGEIMDLLQDEMFQPEPILVKFPYAAGDESDVALPEPLEPGRYGFVCFLPDTDDPEGTPHAFLGMVADFTVE